jgi:predicted ester cyclase
MRISKILAGGLVVLGGCASEQAPPAAEATAGQEVAAAEPVSVEPAPVPAAVVAPAPEPLTAEQLLAAVDACDAAWMAHDEAQLRDCYAEGAVFEQVDSGQPVVKGGDAAIAMAKPYWSAFSDMTGPTTLTLLDDHSLVLLRRARGTHTGELMGVAATNKSVDMVLGAVAELTPDGKLKAIREYGDMGTMLGQLGQSKAPHRKAQPTAAAAARVTALTPSATAQANEQLARDATEAWNAGDYKTLGGFLAKDWLLSDQTLPADLKGAKALAMLKTWRTGFPDAKLVASDSYTAGDYVAFEQNFSGTNTGVLPPFGVKKATGKPVEVRLLQIFKIADGKISEIWLVGNGVAIAGQLGLLPAPAAPAAAAPAAAAAPVAAATPAAAPAPAAAAAPAAAPTK